MQKIPMARPEVTPEMIEAVTTALQNERLVLGESVFKFEEEFARYCGTKHAVAVSSGTDALQLVFTALDLGGKEVLTTPLSFIATANAVIEGGGRPAFSDASEEDNNMDPVLARKAVGKQTAALLPVHLFGHPSRMGEINELAEEKDLFVVEDACQAHGASIGGRKTGSLGDAGCFSFYPTKNMTVGGDGGMITTNDGELAKKLAKLRDCGRISRYVHDVVGYTSRLNTANAAFGRVQLRNLDGWNERRRQIAAKYDEMLAGVPELHRPPRGGNGVVPVYHLYAIHCQKRDELASHLQAKGIECGVHYPVPIHMQPIYQSLYGYKGGEWPVAERLSDSLLSLPMFPALKDAEIRYVAETVRSFYGR